MRNNEDTWKELVDAQEVWEKLTIHHFVNLAETMPHRVEEVIKPLTPTGNVCLRCQL